MADRASATAAATEVTALGEVLVRIWLFKPPET